MRSRLIVLFLLLSASLALSYYFPVVTTVEVFDNQHYSDLEIKTLANIKKGSPFLWITPWRVQKLEQDPWIARAVIYKHWPDKVSIRVVEREAFLTDQTAVYAKDGTLLPDANKRDQNLIQVAAWGMNRQAELLALLAMLIKHNEEPKMVSYTPAGFTIQLANQKRLYTPSLEALRTHWASYLSQAGARVYVYPWGVSAVND